MAPAIAIRNLTHRFPPTRNAHEQPLVLDNVNAVIQKGEIFGLLGPNGGGKTTLFRIVSTAIEPTGGSVEIFGDDISKNPDMARRRMGVVFQSPSLDKKLSLLENVIHQGRLYGLTKQVSLSRADGIFSRLSIKERGADLVEHLSGGLQRRGEIAKSMIHFPELLILDEPSTGLDPGARHEMWACLMSLKNQGVTIFLTTHLMEEGDKCDRLMILHRGRAVASGTPVELKKRIGGDIVTIHCHDPNYLAGKIREKMGHASTIVGQVIRIEINDGHKFIPTVVEAFPGLIQSVTLGKPTLEDVFIRETGQVFWNE